MKFCPECGTLFETNARFCMECGFDKSTVNFVEPAITLTPGVSVNETNPEPSISFPLTTSTTQVNTICPECRSLLDPDDRFCPECGHDTTILVKAREEVMQPHAIPLVEEIISPPEHLKEPVKPEVAISSCPKCGKIINFGERFCQECGFDTSSRSVTTNKTFELVEQPAQIRQPDPVYIPPVAENVPLPVADLRTETVIPSPLAGIPTQSPPYIPPSINSGQARKKGRKPLLWVVLIIFGLGVLGAGGWFVYNSYIASQGAASTDTISDMALPPISETDTVKKNAEVSEQPVEAAPRKTEADTKPNSKVDQELAKQKTKPTTKPPSKVDQELSRQKAKEQNKPSQPAAVQAQNTKSDLNANDKLANVLLEVGRKETAKNKNPKNPTKLSIQRATMIVRITTDHYNDGMGTSGGGTIMIKDRDNKVIASFRAFGKTGKDGTPGAKWVCEPHKVLEKGTYYISDSDMPTWSKSFWGTGFVIVEGYEIE